MVPPQYPLWKFSIVCWDSFYKRKFNKTPLGSFQYRYSFITQNLAYFSFTGLALVLLKPAGAYKICSTYTILEYHGDKEKSCITCTSVSSWFEWLVKKFTWKDSQLEFFIIFSSPWPLISLVGLISMSYSSNTTIHFSLFPFGSGCVRIHY